MAQVVRLKMRTAPAGTGIDADLFLSCRKRDWDGLEVFTAFMIAGCIGAQTPCHLSSENKAHFCHAAASFALHPAALAADNFIGC
jgi:hypothetical protein